MSTCFPVSVLPGEGAAHFSFGFHGDCKCVAANTATCDPEFGCAWWLLPALPLSHFSCLASGHVLG